MKNATPFRIIALAAFLAGSLVAIVRDADRVSASSAAVTLQSGTYATRTTIPVTIDGQHASCVLDTGSSAVLVSPQLARAAGLVGRSGSFELAPDGHTYLDRMTTIGRLSAGSYSLRSVPALITSTLSGNNALCGYDFFAAFPTLIDRDHHTVTLFPPSSKLAGTRCLPVELTPRVPVANVEINGTWLDGIVLDSGMAGGGALWDGVRSRLRQPLVTDSNYQTLPSAIHQGMACGAVAAVRYASGTASTSMPLCTEPQKPDGYNGIIETNVSTIHAMAVDYPRRRICFDIAAATPEFAAPAGASPTRSAWSRYRQLRPPE
ncbi:MAG: retropepsin-like aspartic protease [Candidatus Baltobacteraceae bacterium]